VAELRDYQRETINDFEHLVSAGARCVLCGTQDGASMSRTLLERASRQVEILALRSLELADRVAAGEIPFLDAVDIAYEAAVWSGLLSTVGDDVVQATLAAAFANARSPA
jgi:hypothetical protein